MVVAGVGVDSGLNTHPQSTRQGRPVNPNTRTERLEWVEGGSGLTGSDTGPGLVWRSSYFRTPRPQGEEWATAQTFVQNAVAAYVQPRLLNYSTRALKGTLQYAAGHTYEATLTQVRALRACRGGVSSLKGYPESAFRLRA